MKDRQLDASSSIEEALEYIKQLTQERDERFDETAKLQVELIIERERYHRLRARLERSDHLMSLRVTALCALLELPDPKWSPLEEDMKWRPLEEDMKP